MADFGDWRTWAVIVAGAMLVSAYIVLELMRDNHAREQAAERRDEFLRRASATGTPTVMPVGPTITPVWDLDDLRRAMTDVYAEHAARTPTPLADGLYDEFIRDVWDRVTPNQTKRMITLFVPDYPAEDPT